jgi:hypothetical protein
LREPLASRLPLIPTKTQKLELISLKRVERGKHGLSAFQRHEGSPGALPKPYRPDLSPMLRPSYSDQQEEGSTESNRDPDADFEDARRGPLMDTAMKMPTTMATMPSPRIGADFACDAYLGLEETTPGLRTYGSLRRRRP